MLTILHEDAELLVVNKPPDLVCHPSKAGPESSLIGRLRLHLGPGSRPQLVNRLDRETSGVVVAAKTADAARSLRQIWEGRAVEKEYWALVRGWVVAEEGVLDAPLGRDESSAVAIKDGVRPDGASARTRFRVGGRLQRPEGEFTWLRVWPETGRKHQIRIHLSHLGHPIVGDKIYGGDERVYLDFVVGRMTEEQRARMLWANQALHARAVRFPWKLGEVCFTAEPPAPWAAWLEGT